MNSLTKAFFTAGLLLVMTGCATTGPRFSEMTASLANLPSDTGRIYIYRSSSFGAAVQPEVKLNGEVVGQSVPYGFFYVDKKPGNYEVMTSTEVDRKLSMTLESGQTRFVRLSISFGFFVGHVYPELVEDEIGRQEIQDLRYIGNSGP